MNHNGVDKFFGGSIAVGDTVFSRKIETDNINGKPAEDYVTNEDIPNPDTLKEFVEEDGGLIWKGVKLVPPNSVIEDRPYTSTEISTLVESIWDKYDGSVEDEEVDEEVDVADGENGTVSSDWEEDTE